MEVWSCALVLYSATKAWWQNPNLGRQLRDLPQQSRDIQQQSRDSAVKLEKAQLDSAQALTDVQAAFAQEMTELKKVAVADQKEQRAVVNNCVQRMEKQFMTHSADHGHMKGQVQVMMHHYRREEGAPISASQRGKEGK